MQPEADFKERVIKAMNSLPPQQQLVASYLIEHLNEVPFTSVPELSKKVKVSEATVVRFAQRVGYDGFSGLKTDLMASLKEKVSGPTEVRERLGPRVDNDTLEAVVRQEVHNIETSAANITRDAFQKTASALFKADHVYTFGLGVSSYMAELFTYLLVQTGLRASTLTTKFSSPLEQLVPMRLTDLLVVLSFPPYSKATIDMVRETKSRGIPSLAICDKVTAPAGLEATYVLTVRTENMMFTNSLAALIVMMNALITEIAVRHGDSVEAVARINQILSSDSSLIDDVNGRS